MSQDGHLLQSFLFHRIIILCSNVVRRIGKERERRIAKERDNNRVLWRLLGVNLADGIRIYGIAVYPATLSRIACLSQGFTHPFGGERLSGIAGEILHYLRIGHIEAFHCRFRFRGKGEITEQQFHLCRIDLEGFAVSMQFNTPVRDKGLFRIVPIAYSFQYSLAMPQAYSRKTVCCQCRTKIHEEVMYGAVA